MRLVSRAAMLKRFPIPESESERRRLADQLKAWAEESEAIDALIRAQPQRPLPPLPTNFTTVWEPIMNEEQVNLQAIQQYVEQHADRKLIEQMAKGFRDDVTQAGEIGRLALALVGAELAAQP